MAVFLFGIGITFLLLGVLHFRDKDHGLFIAFTALGCVAFLPGAYVAFNLVQVLRGVPGFHLSQCKLGLILMRLVVLRSLIGFSMLTRVCCGFVCCFVCSCTLG